ncbi:hypothetical protein EVAR_69408_1 [Eumeta japonica]|uniref:Uncharacterized protein n=1 Tax=Eumeta variegata TaxID=151549 RepID=A0A4C1ZBW5_EUMVA|nr:hypothetical protein EVAR_69408_1 [Eumeta japonica]
MNPLLRSHTDGDRSGRTQNFKDRRQLTSREATRSRRPAGRPLRRDVSGPEGRGRCQERRRQLTGGSDDPPGGDAALLLRPAPRRAGAHRTAPTLECAEAVDKK